VVYTLTLIDKIFAMIGYSLLDHVHLYLLI